MAVDWYVKSDADDKLDMNEIKDKLIAKKSVVNSCKNQLKALWDELNAATLDLTTEQKQELLTEINKYKAVYDAIVAEGF